MTRKEFRKTVAQSAKNVLKRIDIKRSNVIINHSLPTIDLDGYFFAQGDDAQELLDGVPLDINEKTWLLFYLDSAGIFDSQSHGITLLL